MLLEQSPSQCPCAPAAQAWAHQAELPPCPLLSTHPSVLLLGISSGMLQTIPAWASELPARGHEQDTIQDLGDLWREPRGRSCPGACTSTKHTPMLDSQLLSSSFSSISQASWSKVSGLTLPVGPK